MKTNTKNIPTIGIITSLLVTLQYFTLKAQGPRPSYFYNPHTELSFASCFIYSNGGSKSKIPFMPMVSDKRAPYGTAKYTKDINVDAPIVFIGNGIPNCS